MALLINKDTVLHSSPYEGSGPTLASHALTEHEGSSLRSHPEVSGVSGQGTFPTPAGISAHLQPGPLVPGDLWEAL